MTILSGPEFFDGRTTHAAYRARRDSGVSANDLLEKPVLDAMVGDVRDLDVFDLGCGDGRYGAELLERGCRSYTGVDAATRMVESARERLAGTSASVTLGRAETLSFAPGSADLVVSRMTLHWVADLAPLFDGIWQMLRPGGRFVFSVEHPILTSCDLARRAGKGRTNWIVDDYFVEGPRVTEWFGARVQKQHRTTESYFQALLASRFQVQSLREATPSRERFPDAAEFAKRQKVPLMLLLSAKR